MRGLKLEKIRLTHVAIKSHPTRVRGLKPGDVQGILPGTQVAPHAGAWIETPEKSELKSSLMSHPTRVRGLKLHRGDVLDSAILVAPHAGAWIET